MSDRGEKETAAPSRNEEAAGHEFSDSARECTTARPSGVNPPAACAAFEYPADSRQDQLCEELERFGIAPKLAARIAQSKTVAAILEDHSPSSQPTTVSVSLHEMLLFVLDAIGAEASPGRGVPSPEQIAQATFAFAVAWQRPWLRGMTPSQLGARCGVSREMMCRRVDRVKRFFRLPLAKSEAARKKLSEGRRRFLGHPTRVEVQRVGPLAKKAAA